MGFIHTLCSSLLPVTFFVLNLWAIWLLLKAVFYIAAGIVSFCVAVVKGVKEKLKEDENE